MATKISLSRKKDGGDLLVAAAASVGSDAGSIRHDANIDSMCTAKAVNEGRGKSSKAGPVIPIAATRFGIFQPCTN